MSQYLPFTFNCLLKRRCAEREMKFTRTCPAEAGNISSSIASKLFYLHKKCVYSVGVVLTLRVRQCNKVYIQKHITQNNFSFMICSH